jgi:heme A synthase
VERTGSSRHLTIASIACGVALIAVGIIEIVADVPLLNVVTAVLVIAGGLFLVVSSWWARRQHVRS